MGPKAKMTDEKKQEMFEAWKGTNEYQAIEKFIGKRAEIARLEQSNKDMYTDHQPYLDAMHQLVAEMKVPGRKAKSYEQMYVRTMIFDKIPSDAPNYVIDGVKYDFTSSAAVDTFKYKGFLVEVYNYLDPQTMEMECTFENYTGWKKELIKVLK